MTAVLLAHANPLTREIARQELSRQGHECHLVSDGRAAFDVALSESIDLIVLDVALAWLDGEGLPGLIQATGWSGPCISLLTRSDGAAADLPLGFVGQVHMEQPGGTEWIEQLGTYLPRPNDRYADLTFESLKGFDRLSQRYRERLPTVLGELHASFEARDWPDVRRRAHAIKGGAACFGFEQLTHLAAKLEQHMIQGETDAAMPVLAQMQNIR